MCRVIREVWTSRTELAWDKPDVSIIIPAHNAERYIAEALNSAVSQVGVTIEVIVISDNSSDETVSIVKGYVSHNITLISTAPVERSVARNIGLDVARGNFIILLDADDVIAPTMAWKAIKILRENDALQAVIFHSLFFEKSVPQFVEGHARRVRTVSAGDMLNSSCPPINSIVFRSSNERFPPGVCVCEDWIFWRAMLRRSLVCVSSEVQCAVRRHEANSTRSQSYLLIGELAAIERMSAMGIAFNRGGYLVGLRHGKLLFNEMFFSTWITGRLSIAGGLVVGFVTAIAKLAFRR